MNSTGSGIGKGGGVLLGAILVSLVVFSVLIGPARALRIAEAAATNIAVDGLFEERGSTGGPTFELGILQQRLLPGQSGQSELVHAGVAYPLHWSALDDVRPGSRRPCSVDLSLELPVPFTPCLQMRLYAGPVATLFERHLTLRAAATVGVESIWSDVLVVGNAAGEESIRGLFERLDDDSIRLRRTADEELDLLVFTPVDHNDDPWQHADRWSTRSGSGGKALDRLRSVITALGDTALSSYALHDTLVRALDVDAFLRFHAFLELFEAGPEQYLLLHDPRTGRLAPLITGLGERSDTAVTDALRTAMRSDITWRYRYEGYRNEAFRVLFTDGFFDAEAHRLQRRLTPALRTDRRKIGTATEEDPAEYPVNLARARREIREMRMRHLDRWERMTSSDPTSNTDGPDR